MPTYFVAVTASEPVKLFIVQKELEEVERALRAWPYHHGRADVFEMRLIPHQPGQIADPTGHVTLAHVSSIFYINQVERHRGLLGTYLDELPFDQQIREIEDTVEYLNERRAAYEHAKGENNVQTATG